MENLNLSFIPNLRMRLSVRYLNLLTNSVINTLAAMLLSIQVHAQIETQKLDLDKEKIPAIFQNSIRSIQYQTIGQVKPIVSTQKINEHLIHVNLSFQLKDSVAQDDWQLILQPSFVPDFQWAPHLTPTKDHIIAQHVFRSPAMIMSKKAGASSAQINLVLIADLDLLSKNKSAKWYMDLNAETDQMVLGMSDYKVKEHVLFVRKPGSVYPTGKTEIGFYLMADNDKQSLQDPWRNIDSFLWSRWGAQLYKAGQPLPNDMEPFIQHTYNWAFNSWAKSVWQEFQLNGKDVGAPVFIVNITQSPNYPGEIDEREFRSIWNQAWFSSLRSASGLYRYGRRIKDSALVRKANLTKELALAFPQDNGLFCSVIGTPMEDVEINGKKYNRSVGWNQYYFGNSDRNPFSKSAPDAPYHILDMSWTANEMLDWYVELDKDPRLLNYITAYAKTLVTLQSAKGFFPAWLDRKSHNPLGILDESPETSMSVTFLLNLYKHTGNKIYFNAANNALKAVMSDIIPFSKWEDFETYYSCSRVFDSLVNHRIERNKAYKQNTLSIYWTAEALLDYYKITGSKSHLELGERVLDELLMYQASWQPPYIFIDALGGFGVMNADGEWNDSRQCLFAELIIKYGKELKRVEYIQRGVAALKASFVMMYCKENPKTKLLWEKRWPFFNSLDEGFMMENYGHGGETGAEGLGIGEFTIYDWGNGAAAEAYNRILDHFGKNLFK